MHRSTFKLCSSFKRSRYWLSLIFAVRVCIKIQFVLQDCAQIFIRLHCSPWLPFNHAGCRRAPSVIKHFFGFGHNLSEGRTGHTRWQTITSFSVLVKLTWVARQMVESKCENLVLGPKGFFFFFSLLLFSVGSNEQELNKNIMCTQHKETNGTVNYWTDLYSVSNLNEIYMHTTYTDGQFQPISYSQQESSWKITSNTMIHNLRLSAKETFNNSISLHPISKNEPDKNLLNPPPQKHG